MAARHRTKGFHRSFIRAIVVWYILCVVIVVSSAENPVISKDTTLPPMGPVVSGTNQTSTVISVVADYSCNPVVRYANDSFFSVYQSYDHEISSLHSGTDQAIRMSDLEPATKYHYNMSGCGVQEIDRTFSTFPAIGSCAFIVYGDTREQAPIYNQTERHKLVADRIAQEKNISFVINSGDLVSESNDPGEWSRFFNSTEKLRSMTTYDAVPGNHDTNRSLFRQFFGTDETTFLDCGNTRIAMLDSIDASSLSQQEQAEWLKSAFRSHEGAKIVIMHYPVYSSDEKHFGGWQDIQSTLVPAFQESGVRLVFSSHVHAFEQVERDGIIYITEARGGAPAYPLNITRIPGSVRSYENTLGYSRVTVDPSVGKITIEAIRVADVSSDLQTVTKIYPQNTIDTKIIIPFKDTNIRFPEVSELLFSHRESEGISRCRNLLIRLSKLPI
jgi:3',5'-cyclic AMP phosphodiesterase CpdA